MKRIYERICSETRELIEKEVEKFLKGKGYKKEKDVVEIFLQTFGPKLIEKVISNPSHSLYSLIDEFFRENYNIPLEKIKEIIKESGSSEEKTNPKYSHSLAPSQYEPPELESFEEVSPTRRVISHKVPMHRSEMLEEREEVALQYIKTPRKAPAWKYAETWSGLWKDEKFSKNYQNFPQRCAAVYLFQKLFKEEDKHKIILDLGSGRFSPLVEAFEKNNIDTSNIIAVDISKDALKSLKGKVHCVVCYSPYLPFRDSSIDIAVASQFLRALPRVQKPAQLLSINRVLKSYGEVIVAEPIEDREDRESIREIELYLKDMGYEVKIREWQAYWKNRPRPTRKCLIISKKGKKDLRDKEVKWFAIHELIDGNLEVLKRFNNIINIDEILNEIKIQKSIDVMKEAEIPFRKPTYEEIKKEIIREKEEIERKMYEAEYIQQIRKIEEKISNVFKNEKERDIYQELIMKALTKGYLEEKDINEVFSKHKASIKVLSEINRKASFNNLPAIKIGKYTISDFRDFGLPQFPLLHPENLDFRAKIDYSEIEKLAKKRYEEKLKEYEKSVEEWKRLNTLHL